MHPVREKMNLALKAIAVAKLRQLGFKGSFPHFRRIYQKHAELVVFQFNKYAGSFVVEIASITTEQVGTHWKADLSLSNANVYDTDKRHRLGAVGNGDNWFVFGKTNDEPNHEQIEADSVYESIAERVAALFASEGEQWWAGSNPAFERDGAKARRPSI